MSDALTLQTRELSAPNVSDETLAEMRDDATVHFESGEFLAAATLFERVLLANPTCPKANFNLAVILQTLGACAAADERENRP